MYSRNIALALLVILILLLVFWSLTPTEYLSSITAEDVKKAIQDPRSFYELTDGERLQYIVDTYFKGRDRESKAQELKKKKEEDNYIATLPRSEEGCEDGWSTCAAWAANDECSINPEFMLYHCAKSCKACALSEQEKFNLTQIYNSRAPLHCVYHGLGDAGRYPDPQRELSKFDLYYNYPISKVATL